MRRPPERKALLAASVLAAGTLLMFFAQLLKAGGF